MVIQNGKRAYYELIQMSDCAGDSTAGPYFMLRTHFEAFMSSPCINLNPTTQLRQCKFRKFLADGLVIFAWRIDSLHALCEQPY